MKLEKLKWISLFSIAAFLSLLIPTGVRADVHDNAQIFTPSVVDDANRDMKTMEDRYHKQLVIETFAAIPDDQKAAEAQDSSAFFTKWMLSRAKELKVNGVYALICMDPKHLEVDAGKNTVARGEFTKADIDSLRRQMQAALRDRDYDKTLSDAVETVDRTYAENITTPSRNSAPAGTGYSSNGYHTTYNPPFNSPNISNGSSAIGITFGSLLCMVVGGILIISLIKSVFRGNNPGSFGGGGYYPPNQGNPGNWGGNYGGGGGFGYGGGNTGGGFGKGFLGGLLGGAIGGYAADQFDHRNDQNNAGFSNSGNDNSGGNFGGGSSSFDSGPSDAGNFSSDTSSGGDFGSSDSGSSSGDSGSSSGGDF